MHNVEIYTGIELNNGSDFEVRQNFSEWQQLREQLNM